MERMGSLFCATKSHSRRSLTLKSCCCRTFPYWHYNINPPSPESLRWNKAMHSVVRQNKHLQGSPLSLRVQRLFLHYYFSENWLEHNNKPTGSSKRSRKGWKRKPFHNIVRHIITIWARQRQKQALFEEVHWRGAVAPEDYIADRLVDYGCSIIIP